MLPMHMQALTVEQFREIIKSELKLFFTSNKENILTENSKDQNNLVSIKVVIEKLTISKPTVYNWVNKGIIKKYNKGGKTFFDLDEILKSIKSNDYQFGGGRDYRYKNENNRNLETKDQRRYSNLICKLRDYPPLTEKEQLELDELKSRLKRD